MAQSRLNWAVRILSPYMMAALALVSFTAEADQDMSFGGTRAFISSHAAGEPADLIPAEQAIERGAFKLPGMPQDAVLRSVERAQGQQARRSAADEARPKISLKAGADVAHLPEINRQAKGAPFVGIRPLFDVALRHPGPLSRFGLLGGGAGADAGEAFAATTPERDESRVLNLSGATGLHANAQDTPTTMIRVHTPTDARQRARQGATPAVPRAVALASTTPALPDAVPVEVGMAAPKPGDEALLAAVPRDGAQPDYMAQIDQDGMAREEKCLAEAVYFEARSESEQGQAAVAQVVLNRVISGLYPTTICGVVYQNRSHYMACQFSFACDGQSLKINEPGPWALAQRIARRVLEGKTYLAAVGGATHYHAVYVRPYWARSLKRVDKIGAHIFYKLRPGQT